MPRPVRPTPAVAVDDRLPGSDRHLRRSGSATPRRRPLRSSSSGEAAGHASASIPGLSRRTYRLTAMSPTPTIPWNQCLDPRMTVGEDAPRLGEEGARRAKRWLEATTRVARSWTNEDTVAAGKLTFEWPFGVGQGRTFSFDLGGILKDDPFDYHHFIAEVKKYKNAQDQGTHFDNWVAKCYVARQAVPAITDQMMWITWSPFRADSWSALLSETAIESGLVKNCKRVFDTEDPEEAKALIDRDLLKEVSNRLWLVVLSDKQENLVISKRHRAWIAERELLETA